ncbi:MAG: slipin family protein [Phycisphaerales bacterium]|nr:slipin family protein [Phycisphaerales bacterium]
MELMHYILLSACAVVTLVWVMVRVIVVPEGWSALEYRNGRYRGALSAGLHLRPRVLTRVELVDLRDRVLTLSGQEVLSADNVGLRLSAVATYCVADAARAINTVQDYQTAVYAAAQLAIRAVVAGMKLDELLTNRAGLGRLAFEAAREPVGRLGLRLSSIEVRDMMFPGEFKRAFAEVVKARQEGQAAIERARAEAAVLRSLSNTARLLEGNPALMNLRILQSAGGSTGNTLVLGVPGGLTPLERMDTTSGRPSRRDAPKQEEPDSPQ